MLAELFRSHRKERAAPDPALEAALAALVAGSERELPGIAVDADELVEVLARCAPPGEALDAIALMRADELYLAVACARGDAQAIALLDRRYFGKIDAAVAHLRGPGGFVDEVKQHLRESLFVAKPGRPPKIGTYRGRGELTRWLRAAAVRTALNLIEAAPRDVSASDDQIADFSLPEDDPHLAAMKRQYGASFKQALDEAVAALAPQTRLELRHYYLEGLGVEEIGALYRVAPSTISRRLAKARAGVAEETRKALLRNLKISQSEVESILRLIQSRLELSRSALD
jgi:RNA polymerase sigma-70 factor, ECF subfamily